MVKNIIIAGLALVVLSNKVSRDHSRVVRGIMMEETINTLEDMYGWVESDIEGGNISEEIGITYLANIEGTVQDLSNMCSDN
jgi:hypothetical protein